MGWGGKGKGWGSSGYMPMMPMWNWMAMESMMKGKGKGKTKSHNDFKKEHKVFIGNIPSDVEGKVLFEHFKMSGTGARWAEIFESRAPKNTGVVCFATPDQATAAIASMNGAVLPSGGDPIEVDVWKGSGMRAGKW
eukprot:gnl/TRDRNA2_/TRDRNA2_189021_c0_seq1.p2 gnl/TRDRNA2_/TRDRNA2_189021_c0~~gnl/TRDRNA2_/TRDRNA2_189021_c0_seq1.p2  ORF type:complete len:136 (+),score=30.67 gnl/TRDRNA2_/TRDRNA2_189021_c0_seq1:82-489(+)